MNITKTVITNIRDGLIALFAGQLVFIGSMSEYCFKLPTPLVLPEITLSAVGLATVIGLSALGVESIRQGVKELIGK